MTVGETKSFNAGNEDFWMVKFTGDGVLQWAKRYGGSGIDEAEALALRRSGARPAPFFATIKHLTLWGYYTSEAGAIQELGYETIPGQFNGCIPVPPRVSASRSWLATSPAGSKETSSGALPGPHAVSSRKKAVTADLDSSDIMVLPS